MKAGISNEIPVYSVIIGFCQRNLSHTLQTPVVPDEMVRDSLSR